MKKIALALAALLLATVLFSACDDLANSALFDEVLQQYQNGASEQTAEEKSGVASTVILEEGKKPSDSKGDKDPVHRGEQQTTARDEEATRLPNDKDWATDKEEASTDKPGYTNPTLPDISFNGESILIFMPTTTVPEFSMTGTGDALSELLYKRDATVEELLNVCLVCEQMSSGGSSVDQTNAQQLEVDVLSGQNRYDMVLGSSRFVYYAMAKGLYRDLMEVADSLLQQTTQIPEELYEDLTVNGKLFAITGPVSPSFLYNIPVLFCDVDSLEARGYRYNVLAKAAKHEEWTVEYLRKIIDDSYADLDGNGVVGNEDMFGLTLSNSDLGSLAYALGMRSTTKDANSLLANALGSEYNADAADRLSDLFRDKSGYCVNTETIKREQMLRGKTLFAVGGLGNLAQMLLQNDMRYEILPLPKLDEESSYVTVPGGATLYYGISLGSTRSEATALAMAALAAYSEDVVETYLFRYMQSSDSCDIAKIVLESARFDYAETLTSNSLRNLMRRVVVNGQSYMAVQESVKSVSEDRITELNDILKRVY